MSWTIVVYAVAFIWLARLVGRWLWSLNSLHAANQDRKARSMSLEMQRLQLEEQKRALEAQTLALRQQQLQSKQNAQQTDQTKKR